MNTSTAPNPDNGETTKTNRIPLFTLLYRLFFDPSVFLLLQHRRVLNALALVSFASLISGLIMSLEVVSEVIDTEDDWKEWLHTEIQEFGVGDDGKFYWEDSISLPYTTHVADWQIIITNESKFNKKTLEPESSDKGVWISRDSIFLWTKSESTTLFSSAKGGQFRAVDIGKPVRHLLANSDTNSLVIDRDSISEFVNRLIYTTSIVIAVSNVLSILFLSLLLPILSSSLAALSFGLTRQARMGCLFKRLMILNLYISIPPIVVAMIYSSLDIPGANFFVVFFIAYFSFHLFIVSVNRGLFTP